jgi:PBP1b-binding outer membrane lipoprotein LpoB
VERLTVKALWLLGLGALVLAGCSGGGDETKPETEAVKAENQAEAAKWTPEQKEAYKKSMMGHAKKFGDADSKAGN